MNNQVNVDGGGGQNILLTRRSMMMGEKDPLSGYLKGYMLTSEGLVLPSENQNQYVSPYLPCIAGHTVSTNNRVSIMNGGYLILFNENLVKVGSIPNVWGAGTIHDGASYIRFTMIFEGTSQLPSKDDSYVKDTTDNTYFYKGRNIE